MSERKPQRPEGPTPKRFVKEFKKLARAALRGEVPAKVSLRRAEVQAKKAALRAGLPE